MERSQKLFDRAQKVLPGGVNSPVRAFRAVDLCPRFITKAQGAYIYDADGKSYIDYVCSWGPMILGHDHPVVREAVEKAVKDGLSFGAPTEREVEMAELMTELVPNIEMVRMVNSGTEAVMSAIRLARGATGRDKIIKFEGCYHGHSDCLLVKAGSGALTCGVPTSPGVPADVVKHTVVCRYNDLESVKEAFAANPGQIAAVILEPVAANMGVIPGKPEFIAGLRQLCDETGTVLIFDEVITGFRLSYGGAAQVYGVQPDMVCFGKIIGGGMPVGAYGGRREIMECVAPTGPVYQAGTLSGNPLAMYIGLRQLDYLNTHPEVYAQLEQSGEKFAAGVRDLLQKHGLPYQLQQMGSLCTLFFTDHPVESYEDAVSSDTEAFAVYFRTMLENGIMVAPSQFEAMFLSAAHTDADLEATFAAMDKAFAAVKAARG